MKSLLKVTLLFFLGVGLAFAQKTITGTVTDDQGLPLPGATVLVQGTSNGVATDFDGNYSIQANEGDTLEFSFVGYETVTLAVGAEDSLNASLQAANELEEVVVSGYSTATKESFTGTQKTIQAEVLEAKNVANVSQALAGESAGVNVINTSGQPGTVSAIRIRGIGTVNGSRGPLYVLDGVPYDGPLNSINPADIESTTVLKDATATAIYGARGANGVILINTKKGGKGTTQINVDTKTGVNFRLLPRYSTIESPETFIGLVWENLFNRDWATNGTDANGNLDTSYATNAAAYANANIFVGGTGIDARYNMWSSPASNQLIDPATRSVVPSAQRLYTPEDWDDYAFQNSIRQETNLSISGGDQKTQYFTSFGYLEDVGYAVNTDFKRYSTRLNLTSKLNDWLTGSMRIGYTYSDFNNPGQSSDSGSVFWFTDNIPSIFPLFKRYDEVNNNLVPQATPYDDPIYGGYQYDYGLGRSFGALTNSIADANLSTRNTLTHALNTNTSFKVELAEGLKFETSLGTTYSNAARNYRNDPFYGPNAGQNGYISKSKTEIMTTNLLALLRYSRDFGAHSVSAFAAHEAYTYSSSFMNANKYNLVIPDGVELNNAVVAGSPATSYTNEYRLESFFGQVNYSYNDKYFFNGTVRRDGSSRFVKEKWGNFGSAGFAWLVSKEDFMASQNIFSSLKLKASYGLIGEQGGVGFYPGYDLFEIQNLNDDISLSFSTKGNPDLTWEVSKQFQTGIEFEVGNVLEGSIDYYVKNTDDLIFDRRVGPSLGYAFLRVNDGALRNQGLEFDLTAHLIQKQNFFLDLTVNGEMIKNEMTRLPIDPATGEQKVIDISGSFGRAVGYSIFDFYIREYAGVDPDLGVPLYNQYYHDENGNGSLDAGEGIESLHEYQDEFPDRAISMEETTSYSSATKKFVGKSPFPKVRGAFRLNAGFGNFDLSAQFLYSIGGYAYDSAYAGLMHNRAAGGNNYHTDILNRWQMPGDATDVPRLDGNFTSNVNSTSTRFLTKADYLNLNNVRLGYSFTQDQLKSNFLKGIDLWVSGDNLMLLSARDGFNPQTAETGGSDTYRYQPLSTVTSGVRIKF